MSDAHRELVRALRSRAGGEATVAAARQRPWHSATFAGTRHAIVLHMAGDVASAFCAGIGEAEFALHGHIVADIAAQTRDDGIHVEALTLADR